MYRLDYTEAAKHEIKELFLKEPDDAKLLLAALEEIDKQDYPPAELLFVRGKAKFDQFACGFFIQAYERDGIKVWALKVFVPSGKIDNPLPISVRALLAPCHTKKKYIVLAVRTRHKDICYKTKGTRYEQLIEDYHRFECDK
jgi:hypothetical protein